MGTFLIMAVSFHAGGGSMGGFHAGGGSMGAAHMSGRAGGMYSGGAGYGGSYHGGGMYGGGANASCCGAAVGCGNTGCGACDQEDASLSYVGSGRGSYTAQTQYKYVGAGCGEMEYVAPPARPNCFCIISISTLLCLLPLLLWWLSSSSTTGTTPLPYDCNAGLANAQMGWSVSKKAWCCDHMHQGCPTQPPPAPPPPPIIIPS